jgi:carbonic anhydrase
MKNNYFYASLIVIVVFILGACATQPLPVPQAPPQSQPQPQAKPQVEAPLSVEIVHSIYVGEEGPAYWEGICKTGLSQSPINIVEPFKEDLANIAFYYQPSEVNILNNGHTVQVNYDTGSYIEYEGVRYDVAQFHYHAPSEHTVDGKLFPAEIHIVHKDAAGNNKVVIAILLEQGSDENAALAPFINNLNLPTESETAAATDAHVTINAAEFLPAVQTTFRYDGSLTTPPCTEGIKWLVMTTPVQLSGTQMSALQAKFTFPTNRPVQGLNNRSLVEDSSQ